MIKSGIKAIEGKDGNKYVVLWTSNAFEDTEKEIFTTKSLADYVARRTKEPQQERLWFWHVKGSDYGDIVWQDLVGRMLVEVAKIDTTTRGEKMFHALQHPEEFPDLLPNGWGTSHGYWYNTRDKEMGVYRWVDKFETTTLPLHRASNMFGGVKEVIDMSKLTPEKVKGLKDLLGDEEATAIIAAADKESAELEKRAAFKDKKEGSEGDEVPETVATGEQMFELELDDAALENIAERVDVSSAVKESLSASKAEWVKEIAAALKDPIVQLVADAVKLEVVKLEGVKEKLVQQAVSGTLKIKAKSAAKEGPSVTDGVDNELLALLNKAMKQHEKAKQDVTVDVPEGMDLMDQALWRIRHPEQSAE